MFAVHVNPMCRRVFRLMDGVDGEIYSLVVYAFAKSIVVSLFPELKRQRMPFTLSLPQRACLQLFQFTLGLPNITIVRKAARSIL